MLNDREKLIELLNEAPTDYDGNRNVGVIADHLIANGVTVQKKGEWDDYGRYQFMDGTKAIRCTECGCALTEKEYAANHWNFCPVCGADMRHDAPKDGDT